MTRCARDLNVKPASEGARTNTIYVLSRLIMISLQLQVLCWCLDFLQLCSKLATFPGPAQLSVACSTAKRGLGTNAFPRLVLLAFHEQLMREATVKVGVRDVKSAGEGRVH